MPELPDVAVYVEALERRIAGQRLEDIRLAAAEAVLAEWSSVERAAQGG
jgi:formamidopyrimidine-DNA glycosylase